MKKTGFIFILFLALSLNAQELLDPKGIKNGEEFEIQETIYANDDLASARGVAFPKGTRFKAKGNDFLARGVPVKVTQGPLKGKETVLSYSQIQNSPSQTSSIGGAYPGCDSTGGLGPEEINQLKANLQVPLPSSSSENSFQEPAKLEIDTSDIIDLAEAPTRSKDTSINRTIGSTNLGTLSEGVALADRARAIELIDSALNEKKRVSRSAKRDQTLLAQPYYEMPLNQLGEALEKASQVLRQSASILEIAQSGLPSGEIARFRNFFMNADQMAEAGQAAIGAELQAQDQKPLLPFQGLSRPKNSNPLARSEDLKAIFGDDSLLKAANTQEGLINRLVMLNGLPEKEREKALKKLRLADTPELNLADGRKVSVPILHNGYLLGKGPDCSSFVSSVLPTDIRKGRFTTLDFRSMWVYLKTGKVPRPPQWKKGRERVVTETANAFIPIDLYSGQRPIAGDLLVYRFDFETIGHIFIVRDFDPNTLTARVIDSAQSTGTISEHNFELSVYPKEAPRRHLRPGLFALRLKSSDNNACSYSKKGVSPTADQGLFSAEEILLLSYMIQVQDNPRSKR